MVRVDIRGLYVINVDGVLLEDRFVEGWIIFDVVVIDLGVVDGVVVGLYVLVNGLLVVMDV